MKDNHKADVSHTDEFDRMYQEMVKQAEDKYKVKSEHPKTEEEIGLVDNLSSRWVNEFELPNGYIFKDENGNVINATKIVLEKKKKEYPKTFDKCCHIVQTAFVCDVRLHKGKYYDIFRALAKLIVCRDAYWKLYGEEMGLGKPWEPEDLRYVYSFFRWDGDITMSNTYYGNNHLFEFPTEEMRDAFYENFKELIESCKELL